MKKLIEQVKKERENLKEEEKKKNISKMLDLIEEKEGQIDKLKTEVGEIKKEMEEGNFNRLVSDAGPYYWSDCLHGFYSYDNYLTDTTINFYPFK
jgi:hypothetical protein